MEALPYLRGREYQTDSCDMLAVSFDREGEVLAKERRKFWVGNFDFVCGADWRGSEVLRGLVGVCGSTLLDSLSGVAYHGTRSEGSNVISNVMS